MSIRDEVVASALDLAKDLNAGSIILISPEATAIRKKINMDIPVIIARILGGRGDDDDVFVDIMSKLPKNIGKSSLFLKVSRIELMSGYILKVK
jgi:hypothetical protein